MTLNHINNQRYMEIFRELVDEYIETGEPVGSKTISQRMSNSLSSATIRNVMSDLEKLGILCSEHTSSGRKPTDKGWRYLVNSIIEISNDVKEQYTSELFEIQKSYEDGLSVETILEKVTEILSDLSSCASIIVTPAINDKSIKFMEFIMLAPGKALTIIVTDDGVVENRLIDVPIYIEQDAVEKASNYLNAKLMGLSLSQIKDTLCDEINSEDDGLCEEASWMVRRGISAWTTHRDKTVNRLIMKGQSNLLSKHKNIEDLQYLLQKLDERQTLQCILEQTIDAKGIQVFIGSENKAFNLAGCSMIVSPYANNDKKVIGAIGVIGPTCMKYDRLISIVDCTARMIEKLVG